MILRSQSPVLPRSLDEFIQWEPVDGFKYEWNDGIIIKSGKVKKKHLFIIRRLQQLFFQTVAFSGGGALIMEQDVMLSGIQMRRPDLAFFNGEQIDTSAISGEEPIPEFLIEVISPNDDAEKVEEKLVEYFHSNVKVVWHIYPDNEVVYVYTSRKNVQICTETDICSASPVMEDFEISVKELLSTTHSPQ